MREEDDAAVDRELIARCARKAEPTAIRALTIALFGRPARTANSLRASVLPVDSEDSKRSFLSPGTV
jgi:hypothetical protein